MHHLVAPDGLSYMHCKSDTTHLEMWDDFQLETWASFGWLVAGSWADLA